MPSKFVSVVAWSSVWRGIEPARSFSKHIAPALGKPNLKNPILQQVWQRDGCNMKFSHATQTDRTYTSLFYNRDATLPFWQSNVDTDAVFLAHAHRPDRAQAWLRYREVFDSCFGFQRAVMMRGHFEGGILGKPYLLLDIH